MAKQSTSPCNDCVARAGQDSDRCQRCRDYSRWKRGGLSMSDIDGLTARGRLAYLMAKIAGKGANGEEGCDR